LMPPCAHTEWERFTETTENRSTVPPISATLIAADRPARPPPTMITLGFAMITFACPKRSPSVCAGNQKFNY
jgi:hypothetical protein